MGSPDARAYSRNKRGIAGSLIWINFDRHSLLNLIQKCAGTFVADIDEIRPQYSVTQVGTVFQFSVVRDTSIPASATIDQLDNRHGLVDFERRGFGHLQSPEARP